MAIVSVIIPTFNRARKLLRAVESVISQTYTDLEIIVVDDGSTDDTVDSLAQFGERISFIGHSSNLGVSAARNTGIRNSGGPLIAFLDSDDYWLPKKVEVQVDFFERHPHSQICQTEEVWIRKGRRVNPQKKHLKPSSDIFEPSLKRCLVSPSSVMLKRSLLEEVGGFDEDLPVCEDYDLWLRISSQYPVHLIKEYHVVKEGGHSDQLSSRYKGMDRFRIKALKKLIERRSLNKRQLKAALDELSLKCLIYGKGCIKRGKKKEGDYYLTLPENIKR